MVVAALIEKTRQHEGRWTRVIMKIAFVVSAFPTLSETFILNQITGLIDRGHEVDVFANTSGASGKVHACVAQYRLLDRTCYRPTMPDGTAARLLAGTRLILRHIFSHPIAVLRTLNVFRYGRRAVTLELLFGVIPWLRSKPYDIVHCHFGPNGIRSAIFREIGVLHGKIITVFHGHDVSRYVQTQGPRVYRRLFRKGDFFLPVSDRWRRRLVELGCDEPKIRVHRMGVDCAALTFKPRAPKSAGTIRLVSVARLVEKKGIEYAIRAVMRLGRSYRGVRYDIVGDGPLHGSLDRVLRSEETEAAIRFHGWKNQEEVAEFLDESDVLLAPSVTSSDGDQEGIPVVMMEAMALGLPIVTTAHSGIPELVQDGRSGFLVPERDVDALVDKLTYLLEHPEIWSSMGQAGRTFVEQHYNMEQLNDRLVELYRELAHHE